MASNSRLRLNQQDDNPYFGLDATGHTSDLAASWSAPQPHPLIPGPTTPTTEHPPTLARPSPAFSSGRAMNRQQSSIGLRRMRPQQPRTGRQQYHGQQSHEDEHDENSEASDGCRHSRSDPQRPTWLTEPSEGRGAVHHLPSLPEMSESGPNQRQSTRNPGRRQSLFRRASRQQGVTQAPEYDSRIVDLLDVVDPEVSTLTSITNVQNSLFIPSLGRFVNRRPTYDITWTQRPVPEAYPASLDEISEEQRPQTRGGQRPSTGRAYSISSNLEDSHYAVLPPGESLDGWSKEDVDRLNDHVRHMLHSRRSKFKRGLKGFGHYVRRPLGFFVTVYATLITLFGLAWVLFLIGWIYVGAKQLYMINVIDYILVALFAIMGDGLAPFRAVDTYHMIFIAHYHRKSWKLRKKLLLPRLRDHNDLPAEPVLPDLEAARDNNSVPSVDSGEEFSVLNPKEQEKLSHHQAKFAKSHTYYKPHETETHHAFPLKLLIIITTLLDLHSCLQISLGACTWGIPYKHRPFALTTVILCCSITVNATAGLLIWIGDKRTRKKDVIEKLERQELTQEAMQKVKKQNQKAAEEEDEDRGENNGEGSGGWRENLSLPRLSMDKRRNAAAKGSELDEMRESPRRPEPRTSF